MASTPIQARGEVVVGGQKRRLAYGTRRYLYRIMQRYGELNATPNAAVKLSVLIWAMLERPNPTETPEDIFAELADDEIADATAAVMGLCGSDLSDAEGPKKRRAKGGPKNAT